MHLRGDWLSRLHLAVGVAGVLVFLATGNFMDTRLDHLRGMPDVPRLLYRSAHMYILMAALINLVLGAYLAPSRDRVLRAAQVAFSLLLISGLVHFIISFYFETPLAQIERPRLRTGVYLTAAGAVLHALVGVAGRALEPRDAPPVGAGGVR